MVEKQIIELKEENYYVAQAWMVTDLNLSGHELAVYAVIYGFSQDGSSSCYASVEYFARWLGTSTRTVKTIIDSLIEKKLVTKRIETNNIGRFNVYKAYRHPLQDDENTSLPGRENISLSSDGGRENNDRGVVKSVQGGRENFSEDTLYKNKENNKDKNKEGANAPAPQKNSRFSKPSITEIAAYCAEKNISIDPQQFYYFYEAKGWKIGNSPMKNWKAAVQTWVKRGRNSYGNSYSAKPNNCGHNNPEGFDEI